jgi:hypothetical protein
MPLSFNLDVGSLPRLDVKLQYIVRRQGMLLRTRSNEHHCARVIGDDQQIASGGEELLRGRASQVCSGGFVELFGAERRQYPSAIEKNCCATKGDERR